MKSVQTPRGDSVRSLATVFALAAVTASAPAFAQSEPNAHIVALKLVNAERNVFIAGGTLNGVVEGTDPLREIPTTIVDLSVFGRSLNIVAETLPKKVGAVRFEVKGKRRFTRVETQPPYALFGHTNGKYNTWSPSPGEIFTIRVGACTTATCDRAESVALLYRIKVVACGYGSPNLPHQQGALPAATASPAISVSSFSLISVDAERAIAGMDPIRPGATINLMRTGQRLNVRANICSPAVKSVRFGLNGNRSFNVENVRPWMMAGDKNGVFFEWKPTPGTYTIDATPQLDVVGCGTVGQTSTRTIIGVRGP